MKKAFISLMAIIFLAEASYCADTGGFDREAFIASAAYNMRLEVAMVDCIAMALKNNSEILVKKISPLIEDSNVRIQKSVFEPRLYGEWLMEDNTDISTTTLVETFTSKTRTADFNFGFDQKFVTGTKLDFDFYNKRTRSNSAVQIMNPTFDSLAELTVTQPLLKGFGIIVNKANFLIAKNNRSKSQQEFVKDVIAVLTNVKRNYYDFQYAQEQYRVALASLKRVESLHEINKEKYAKGLASNVDLLQSEAEVARMEELSFQAKNVMKKSEDNLKYITNLVDDPKLWNADIVLLDMVEYKKEKTDLVQSILKAFEHRPDYEAAKLELKNKEISVIFYRNNMLPTLDLVGSYGLNGIGKNYEKDLGNMGGGKYQDWSIGVNAKMPFFSDEEKGKYEKAKYEKEQVLIAFKRLEQKIILEVRDAVRNVDTYYEILEASLKSMSAQKENYEAQESRFRAGLVSTHDIIDYQERLARALIDYVKSIIDYNIALAELAKAEGTTLINDNIKVE